MNKEDFKYFLKNNKYFLFAVSIIFLFPLGAYFIFVKRGLIAEKDFFDNILGFSGWVIALVIAWITILKNREDSLEIQKDEIRKRLEIDAFKEVAKVIEKTAVALADIDAYYNYKFIKKLDPIISKPTSDEVVLPSDILQWIYNIVSQQTTLLPELSRNFNLIIKSHEIILTKFDNLIKILEFEFNKNTARMDGLEKYILKLKAKNKLTRNDLIGLKEKFRIIDKNITNLVHCLTDYRTDLMNTMLGKIFKREIPKRKIKKLP